MSSPALPSTATIPERITALQTRIKELKVAKQDASAEVEEMKQLKQQLGADKKQETGPTFQLKTPKGTIDHKPEANLLRKKIFNTLEGIFVKYGASTIDTPVFELREILAGKYGEDSKLIYDLQDQGGELCSLRYDLTVSYRLLLTGIGDLISGPLCAVSRHERCYIHEALPHWKSLQAGPASHVERPYEGVLSVCA